MKAIRQPNRNSACLLLWLILIPDIPQKNSENLNNIYKYLREQNIKSSLNGVADSARGEKELVFYKKEIQPIQNKKYLVKLSNEDLRTLFSITTSVTTHNLTENQLFNDSLLDIEELTRRQKAKQNDFEFTHGLYIAGRHFKEAETFSRKYPQFHYSFISNIIGTPETRIGSHQLLTLDENSDSFRLKKQPPRDNQILVIADPACPFTENAINAIEANSYLKKIFEQKSLWITPPLNRLNTTEIFKWNATHTLAKLGIAYFKRDWPEVDTWATPTFYFFHDGKRTSKTVGWPANRDNRKILEDAIKSSGLDQ